MVEIPDFSRIHAICLGDVMLDRFIEGRVERISPEQPVPVVEVTGENVFPGGAANVARNIAALGGRCTLLGVVGSDEAGATLRQVLASSPLIDARLIEVQNRLTTEKRRYVVRQKQLLRSDVEQRDPLPEPAREQLLRDVTALLPDAEVLIISDYAKGVCDPDILAQCIDKARDAGVPVVVDPKHPDFRRYDGASVIAPNLAELASAAGGFAADDEAIELAARRLLEGSSTQAMLVTRAERGVMLVQQQGAGLAVPARKRQVFDVAGAGDTVVGALALAIGAGADLAAAARIANAAAGVVVGKQGTATASRAEVEAELRLADPVGSLAIAGHAAGVLELDQAIALREQWRREGLSVGFTNGCFDILHAGHAVLLEQARSHCERLIVAINSDSAVARLKGAKRPVMAKTDRARLLAAIRFVDAVVSFEADTPYDMIAELLPDMLFKGADYQIEDVVGADIVQQHGGKVILCDLLPGASTSAVIARIGRAGNPDD